MRKKVLFGIDYTDNESIKMILYLFVGGTAAVIEWFLFYQFFYHVFNGIVMDSELLTILATTLAFCIATLYHYFLCNVLVFNSGSKYKKTKEICFVFLVSIMGLIFNLILMSMFIGMLNWRLLIAKIIASSVVVGWNYFSRKKWIFDT